eukprot:CAMPEP_0171540848 /NCGR_PEP_ID=MMETSP0960-20121227/1432_1 /TAXON_ID=87120 /ORGANISM="Aurantiochytrium limacinum, Strain ATCCMYA-1381" /LENGTH=410 /DNA_ID=CAMNT_0012088109 /DNA_START=1 /DNA_END=1233 /DNA_ORIENTATION=-
MKLLLAISLAVHSVVALSYDELDFTQAIDLSFEIPRDSRLNAHATISRVEPPLPKRNGLFGRAVAMSGAVLAIGSFQDNGQVYIFERQDDHPDALWRYVQTLDSQGQAWDFGRTLAMSQFTSSSRIVVGAPGDSRGSSSAVFIFERNATGLWDLAWTLGPSNASESFFGSSLAVGENVLAVASVLNDEFVVRTYEFSNGNLVQMGRLKPSQPILHSDQDVVVGPNDNIVVVGDPARQPGNGAVVVFRRSSAKKDVFHESSVLLNPSEANALRFGGTLGINHARVAVSGVDFNAWRKDQGQVFVYNSTTNETLKLDHTVHIGMPPNDKFGFKPLLLADNTLVVSAPFASNKSDSVYIFNPVGASQKIYQLGSDVWAGPILAATESRLAVGSPFDGANWTGAAFLLNWDTFE